MKNYMIPVKIRQIKRTDGVCFNSAITKTKSGDVVYVSFVKGCTIPDASCFIKINSATSNYKATNNKLYITNYEYVNPLAEDVEEMLFGNNTLDGIFCDVDAGFCDGEPERDCDNH